MSSEETPGADEEQATEIVQETVAVAIEDQSSDDDLNVEALVQELEAKHKEAAKQEEPKPAEMTPAQKLAARLRQNAENAKRQKKSVTFAAGLVLTADTAPTGTVTGLRVLPSKKQSRELLRADLRRRHGKSVSEEMNEEGNQEMADEEYDEEEEEEDAPEMKGEIAKAAIEELKKENPADEEISEEELERRLYEKVVEMRLSEDMEEIKKIIENFPGVMCVCAHKTEQYVATGGGDGSVRLYTVNGQNLSLMSTNKCHSSPVTAILFVERGLISTSSDGIRFCRVDTNQIYASYETEEPLLTLATIPSEKIVVSGGYDGYVYMFRVADGSLFRKHKLSQSSYPLAIAIDKAGLFVAVAMSDGIVRVLDLFSGDTVFSFNSLSGIITSIWFHENDLLLASYSGAIMRWQTPQMIHTAIAERENKGPAVLNLLLPPSKPETSHDGSSRVPGSLMKGMKPQADWLFKEIADEKLQPVAGKPLAQEGNEEEDEVEQAGFDAPRPSVEGVYETKVDDVVRASFIKRKRELEESRSLGKDKSSSSIVEELTVPSVRQRPSGSVRPKPKPAPKIEPITIEPDEIDPFTINDKTTSGGIVKNSKAEEMRSAAEQLTSCFENAKKLLDTKPSCPEEIAARQTLKDAIDAIKRDLTHNSGVLHHQIKDYAQKILFAIEQLD